MNRMSRFSRVAVAACAVALAGAPAQAQDLVHRFIDPSFGGNPFYSEHLLAIATIHRPAQPTTPTDTPTQEELLAEQLRARFLSQLSGTILDRIQTAAVGTSGTFNFGNQRVDYTRTATETRVTFTNTETNETNTVVIPATGSNSGSTGAQTASAAAREAAGAAAAGNPVAAATTGSAGMRASVEQSLGTPGAVAMSITSGRPGASAEQSLLAASNPAAGGGAVLPPY